MPIHALTDQLCRLLAFILTGGNVPDCIAAETLLPMALPETVILHGDRGYDSDRLRRQIEARGTAPNIPPKSNRRYKPGFSPALYRKRNAVERSFCRLKDFRRIEPDTTSSPTTSSQQCKSQRPCATGYESWP